jgi:hypothetical protein
MLIMQTEGWHAMSRSIPNPAEVLATMECLLCFEAWLDADLYWDAIGDEAGGCLGRKWNKPTHVSSCEVSPTRCWPWMEGVKIPWIEAYCPLHFRFWSVSWLQCLTPRGTSQGPCKAPRSMSTEEYQNNRPAVRTKNCGHMSLTQCMPCFQEEELT